MKHGKDEVLIIIPYRKAKGSQVFKYSLAIQCSFMHAPCLDVNRSYILIWNGKVGPSGQKNPITRAPLNKYNIKMKSLQILNKLKGKEILKRRNKVTQPSSQLASKGGLSAKTWMKRSARYQEGTQVGP